MAQGEDRKKEDSSTGFAGLSSMVSDVESTVAQTARDSRAIATATSSSSPATGPLSPKSEESGRPPYQAPAEPSGGSSAGKWLLGIGAVVSLIWIASQSGDKSSSPSPVYTPNSDTPSVASPSPTGQPSPSPTPAPTRPTEDRPPVGINSVLTSAQLRYCVAEKIRMDAAEGAANKYVDTHVDRFNGMVADYNSRCGKFRYRRGSLESARAEVERYRAALEADGRAQFTKSRSPSLDRTPSSDRAVSKSGNGPNPNRLPKAIAGEDGNLTTAPAPAPGTRNSGFPANSWVSGSQWFCNDGYRKVGESCEKVNAPANAWVTGSNWFCNDGYRKVGESCESIIGGSK